MSRVERREGAVRSIQRRFGAAWLLATTAVIALSSAGLFLLLRGVLSREVGTQFSQAFHVLEQARNAIWAAVGLSLLGHLTLVCVLVAVVTTRLAGYIAWPLDQLQRLAEALGRGDLGLSFHLRRGDQLRELTEALGEIRDRAAGDARAVQEAVARIERLRADLGSPGPAGEARQTQEFLDSLAVEVGTIRARLHPAGRREVAVERADTVAAEALFEKRGASC